MSFLVSRLIQSLLTLFVVSIVVFMAARLTGSPEAVMLSPATRPEDIAAYRRAYGLDQPVATQYLIWASHAIRGDLGTGIHFTQPVTSLIIERGRNSVPLAAIATAMAIVIGIPLGILAASHRGTRLSQVVGVIGVGGQGIPSFWLGMLLVLLFAVNLRWLPATGAAGPSSYILPAFTIGYFMTAGVMRLVRSSMLEALETDYVRYARAKGLTERRLVWRHALPNALLPTVTFLGYMFGAAVAAAITVETVFNWPGIGDLIYEAIVARDFPVVQGVVLVWSAVMVLANLAVDLLYVALDPRVKL